ncbi:MAG: tetratricopeptide repeat protein [Gemmatimonadota bacterium]
MPTTPPVDGAGARSWATRMPGGWGPRLGLALLVALPYLSSLDGGFHYDDSHSIVDNPAIRSLRHLPAFFVDSGTFSAEPGMAMYRPLVLASYALNYALGGYDPRGYHLANLLLHLMATQLVYALLSRLTGRSALGWWGALLFGLHPVQSQAVNYISSRSEVLAAAAVLAALRLSLAPARRVAALGAYAAGLLTKSAAVAFLPLAGLIRVRSGLRPAAHALWPFAALTAAYLVLISLEGFLPRSLRQDVRPWPVHLCTQVKALVYYLQLLVVPRGLSVEPAFHLSRSALDPAVASAGLLMASLAALAARGARRGDGVGVGLLWILAGLAVPFAVPLNVLVNEHRLYLPAAGWALGLVWLARAAPARLAVSAGAAAALLLATLTWQRGAVWRSDLRLWEDAAQRAPAAFRAQANLGLARYESGDLHGARRSLERALALNPAYAKTWSNLGLVLEEDGDLAGAARAYGRAVAMRPDLVGAHLNLARLYLALERADSARVHLATALRLRPSSPEVHLHRGRWLQHQGDLGEARREYERAVELDPGSAPAHNNLGLLFEELGDTLGARHSLERAVAADQTLAEARTNLRLLASRVAGVPPVQAYEALLADDPGQATVWLALGQARLREGNWDGAVEALDAALRLRPQLAGAHELLGSAHRGAGRLERAIAAYEAGLEGTPTARLYTNLAAALAADGQLERAAVALRAALDLDPGNPRAREGLERLQRPPAR